MTWQTIGIDQWSDLVRLFNEIGFGLPSEAARSTVASRIKLET